MGTPLSLSGSKQGQEAPRIFFFRERPTLAETIET
jgi:hypothetical protein